MFSFSSSSSDGAGERTKTITIAYADGSRLGDVSMETVYESSSESSSSLPTPSTLGSGRSILDKLDIDKEKEKYFGYHPIWQDMSLSEGVKLKTLEYLWGCKIFQLFNFLMTHLLAHTPEDPVPFLLELVDRCIRYRDEDGDPPLVFEDSHIHSVYNALDPLLEGSISYTQYLTGMQTLGLTEFNVLPDEMDELKNLAKDVFIREAKKALVNQLDVILGKGRRESGSDLLEEVVEYEQCSLTLSKTKVKN